jgi:hypothetical protein
MYASVKLNFYSVLLVFNAVRFYVTLTASAISFDNFFSDKHLSSYN